MKLTLIRHTQVAVAPGTCYGRSDVPLASTFAEEAAAVRAKLPVGRWRGFSSPAQRCCQLAATLSPDFAIDPRLTELDFGEWELRRWDELPRTDTERWTADFVTQRPPGGEAFIELAQRALGFVAEVTARFPADHALVVTHAGVIRALRAHDLGLPLQEAFSLPVEFGGVHTLRVGARPGPTSLQPKN